MYPPCLRMNDNTQKLLDLFKLPEFLTNILKNMYSQYVIFEMLQPENIC